MKTTNNRDAMARPRASKPNVVLRMLLAAISLAALMLFAGCAQNGNAGDAAQPAQASASNEPSSTQSGVSNEPSKDQVKEDQVDWDVQSAVYDGDRRVVLAYANNSEETIANLKMTFKVSDDATDEELNSAFGPMYGWDDQRLEALRKNGVWGESSGIVDPGQSGIQTRLMLGITYLTDMAQYDLLRPDLMEIAYVHDGKIYTETYDFTNGSYSLSNKVEGYVEWPEGELAEMLPAMSGKYLTNVYSHDTSISFDVEGVSNSEYLDYVKQCKDAGFVTDGEFDSSYYADSSDGKYRLSITYNSDDQAMDVILSAKKES